MVQTHGICVCPGVKEYVSCERCFDVRMTWQIPRLQLKACIMCLLEFVAQLREGIDSTNNTKQIEGEMRKHSKKPILKAVGTVRHHFSHWVLHPIEEEWMRSLNVVGRLSLLNREAEEGPLVVAHQPQA